MDARIINFHIPDCEEFRKGYELYNEKEKKGALYFEALSTISRSWGDPIGMAEGVSVLIRGWNYLFANFDLDKLVNCIKSNLAVIEEFRGRNIGSLSETDEHKMETLFNEFLHSDR